MLTFASWYQPHNWRGRLVRISAKAGRGVSKAQHPWDVVPCLVPEWSLVKQFKSGAITEAQYTTAYLRMLKQRHDDVSAWLANLTPNDNLTHLCHEPAGAFCHRRLVAELVRKRRPDIEVNLH
ncbi:MAG: hypothetical protein EXR49_07175 [Dehalococcoidia bacterium]|nr:hypothetical protein [Dehalococcoidia bacterium]